MKFYQKWRNLLAIAAVLNLCAIVYLFFNGSTLGASLCLAALLLQGGLFYGFWISLKEKGVQIKMDLTRVLGRDAKGALSFGDVGILAYNDDYVVTWQSDYFNELHLDLVNRKLTSWIESIRRLFDENLDSIQADYNGEIFEIAHKPGTQVLYVKNITRVTELEDRLKKESVVVGLLSLDNYTEYQGYENEEFLNEINTRLRQPLVTWAKMNRMFIRRLRSDRFVVLLDAQILNECRQDNFTILQKIKDEADRMEVSITLSMVFAGGTDDFDKLDHTLTELIELVQSRGGDQVAIKMENSPVTFIGGNSERSTQRSKVRVHIMQNSMQDLMMESEKIFILGHQNTDFDCMGAALAMSAWAKALKKQVYIVLKDVPRDRQLQDTMDHYNTVLTDRHTFITEEDAMRMISPARDLVVMVDHAIGAISSGRELLNRTSRVMVVDHHRKSENSCTDVLLQYVESRASSTCELVTELLQSSSSAIPIYEAEATIMYMGMIVDTNRFKLHTSERTFQAAGTLKAWGANSVVAEKGLQEDFEAFRLKNDLIHQAQLYRNQFMIAPLARPVNRTMMSQVSDALLNIKGCRASFTIGINEANGKVAVSARSDGSYNVQKIMEVFQGGGHFSAAALERGDVTVEQMTDMIKQELDKEDKQ